MTDKTVAETILKQLGGRRFAAMTGAKNFIAVDKGLVFMIPRSRNIRKITVDLKPDDTYTMTFYKMNGANRAVVKQDEGVYAEDLQARFTDATGLYTHL